MKTEDAVKLAIVVGGGYLIYQLLSKATSGVAKVASTVTAPVSNAIASVITTLTQSPPMNVLGNVIFPDGTNGGPLSAMKVFTDSSGNVYVKSTTGDLYQVGQSDSNGNWPVTMVIPDNFGTTNPTAGW